MPIIFPVQVIEKVKETIKEVVRTVYTWTGNPSVGMLYSYISNPSKPSLNNIAQTMLDIGLFIYSLRLTLKQGLGFVVIANPEKPTATVISMFGIETYGVGLMTQKPSLSYNIAVSTKPAVAEPNSFSLSADKRVSP